RSPYGGTARCRGPSHPPAGRQLLCHQPLIRLGVRDKRAALQGDVPAFQAEVDVQIVWVAQLRVDEVILQGALDRVQDALGQLNIVVDKKFLLLRVGRADDKGAGVCKVDRHPALAGGDRLGKVEVPAGEVADLS